MTLRTKGEQKAYLDGYEMCAKCIKKYLTDEDKQKLECLLAAVRNAVDIEDETVIKALEQQPILDKIRAEILDEAEYAYADFDQYKEDILNTEPDELPDDDFRYGMERAIEIIDKYRKGSVE